MFRTAHTVELLQAVAATLGLAVLLWSTGFPSLLRTEAADLINISDLLSSSAPNTVSNHTISFELPADGAEISPGDDITITFPAASFDLSNIDAGDIDLATGTDASLQDGAASGGVWGVATSSTTIVLTSGTASIGTGTAVTIEVGTNATFGGTGDGQIVNPASSTYEILISTSGGDSGKTHVVILDTVEMTAAVAEEIAFTMEGVEAGALVNGTTTTGTSTPTTIPFGPLTPGVYSSTTAQDIVVATNAENGFAVTVQVDSNLLSSNGSDIDGFNNGSDTDIPATWVKPTAESGSEATYGHWGVTSEDATTTRAVEFGTDEWIAASTTPRIIMSHDGRADGVTPGIGRTRVGYTISISGLQEAGDYSTTLTYVTTTVF